MITPFEIGALMLASFAIGVAFGLMLCLVRRPGRTIRKRRRVRRSLH